MEYYLATKSSKVLTPATTWMDLEDMLNEGSQTQNIAFI